MVHKNGWLQRLPAASGDWQVVHRQWTSPIARRRKHRDGLHCVLTFQPPLGLQVGAKPPSYQLQMIQATQALYSCFTPYATIQMGFMWQLLTPTSLQGHFHAGSEQAFHLRGCV